MNDTTTPDLLRGFESDRDFRHFARASTVDPRLVAVAIRDECPEQPDGDAMVPTCVLGGGYGRRDDYISADEDLYSIVSAARDHYGNDEEKITRYLRMFHGALAIETQGYGNHHAATMYAVVTPEWAELVGVTAENATDAARGTLAEWRAFDDGDVYGIGVLLNREHVEPFEPGDDLPYDDGDGWEWLDGPVWGHYGDDYAAESVMDELKNREHLMSETEPLITTG